MADKTGIGWTDATFNPWWGCAEVSPGCAGPCYARTLAARYGHAGTWPEKGRLGADREHEFRFFGETHWKVPLALQRKSAREGRVSYGGREDEKIRVFCASMADVFEDRLELVPWRKRLFELIYETPDLDWQLLTKRPENIGRMLGPDGVGLYAVESGVVPCPQPNVWLGTSIENSRYTWRADVLREIPAAIRFISAEPLLGSLFSHPGYDECNCNVPEMEGHGQHSPGCSIFSSRTKPLDLTGIDQVIAGGESGSRKARPMYPDWAREIRDACLAVCRDCAALGAEHLPVDHDGPGFDDGHTHWASCARPAFFFKQHGSWRPVAPGEPKGGRDVVLEPDGRWRLAKDALPSRESVFMRYAGASPKSGGDQLDGRAWTEMPCAAVAVAV